MQKSKKMNVYVPDTSALINRVVSVMIENKEIPKGSKIIIPKFVISELENQANKGKDIGFLGIDEIKALHELAKSYGLEISYEGRLPTFEEIQLSKAGRIDFLIRDIAFENKATLITSDFVQAKVAEAMGIEVVFHEKPKPKELLFEKYFDDLTSSIHLKEGDKPKAKKGTPGNVRIVELSDEPLSREELEKIADNILNAVRITDRGFVESSDYEATVVQLGQYRIAITRPYFSDGMEITIVRPMYKLKLEDYGLSDKLMERIDKKAEGILIAGPPGHGKSTFAQAVAEHYYEKGKIVKTMEHPRDLNVPKGITQYAPLKGSMENTADILLLVRPDYVIYDEVRKTKDFLIFSDMRMAGIGMIGIVHASKAIEAVQRFIGRIELGLIPQIVDTVIFIWGGKVAKVYELKLTVKTPTGMTEDDLARPVVEVRDFETQKLEYEIYTYGEQTVVIPISEVAEQKQPSALQELAKEAIINEISKYAHNPEIEFLSDKKIALKIDEEDIPKVIGKKGKTISEIEKKLGIKIDVQPRVETLKKEVDFDVSEKGAYVVIHLDESLKGKEIDVYKGDEYLFSATVSKKGIVKVKKSSEIGKKVLHAKLLGNLRVLV